MISRIITPPLSANAYVLCSEKIAVIDPGGDADFILTTLKNQRIKTVDAVLLTHLHYDHAVAANAVAETFGAALLVHKDEYEFSRKFGYGDGLYASVSNPQFVVDGDVIEIGEYKLKVLHTPGHTPGSVCFYDEHKGLLFSGDTVFPNGSIGRTDLPGGSYVQLHNSLKKLSRLTIKRLYPGHGAPVENGNWHIQMALSFF